MFPSSLPLQKKEYNKSLRQPDSENLVSHRAAMSVMYLASSIATSAIRMSFRSAASWSRRVLTFHCVTHIILKIIKQIPTLTFLYQYL